MALGISRIGDVDSAGDVTITGSSNVFVNGLGVQRVTDRDRNRDNGSDTKITGKSNVFVNGLQVTRVTDRDTANNVMVTGSPNVFTDR
jgi:uncharacterized Zn-binding protein involved in type VI secretion